MSLAEFYRRKLRRYAVIRAPKEALWTARWYLRWRVLRPVARALLPASVLRRYHLYAGMGWRGVVRHYTAPRLPLVSHSRMAGLGGQFAARTLFAAARVPCGPLEVLPAALRNCVPALDNSYAFPAVVVSELRHAKVVGRSNLVEVGGAVVHHDLYRFTHDFTSEELHGRRRIAPARQTSWSISNPKPFQRLSRATSFTDACAPNYAHWLTEVLPRIGAYASSRSPGESFVALIDKGLHANLRESARLLLGPRAELVQLAPDAAVEVDLLEVVSPAGYIPFDRRPGVKDGHSHGVFSPPALLAMRESLARALGAPPPGLPRRILVRRTAVSRTMRNEEELQDRLAAFGFVAVHPERLSFSEQFHLFANADVVVGATGAALANLIFCRPVARIVICLSAHPEHSFGYWRNMAAAVGNCVAYVLGPVEGSTAAGIHADFSIDVEAVLEAVADGAGRSSLIPSKALT